MQGIVSESEVLCSELGYYASLFYSTSQLVSIEPSKNHFRNTIKVESFKSIQVL